MGDDRRTDAPEQCHRHPEGDADPGEHQHQPDVAGTRTGSTCTRPNSTPCTTITATRGSRLSSPRITTPLNTISSTTGAAITAVTTSDTT
jgi:hypothetical protein